MIQHGPYTPIVLAGNLFFVSGQIGVDSSTNEAAADIRQQTQQVLDNLTLVLRGSELSLSDVVKTTVFLKNMDDYAVVNEVYQTYFKEPRPSRSCIEVAALPKIGKNEILIEIEAVAMQSDIS